MKRLVLLLAVAVACIASQAALTLEDLMRGTYSASGIGSMTPLNDGERYACMNANNTQIVAYAYKTGEQTEVLFDLATARCEQKLGRIDGFTFSPNEQNILIRTQTQRIYRHSATAVHYIYNVRNRTLVPLSDGGPQEVPAWSADGNMVGFVRDGNLFIVKLLFGNAETQVTKDGEFSKIINGKPDWVNEEEFSFNRAFDFNADNTILAWIRYDETEVPTFSFPWYRGSNPAKDEYATYPGAYSYKYPVAGEQNSRVSVMVYDIKSHRIQQMKLPLDADGYVPRIRFTSDPDRLCILTQNRHQDRLEIYMGNPRSTECKLVVRDEVDKYIEESVYKALTFHEGGFVLMSERSGYNHLYLYDLNGTLKRTLTQGDYEVKDFYGYNPATGDCYYASNEEGVQYRGVYKVDAKGRKTRLSQQLGTNSAVFSKTFKYYVNTYSNITTPYYITLHAENGKVLKVVEDNAALVGRLQGLQLTKPQFFSFTTSEGVQLNGYLIAPADAATSGKKYPVVLLQYSGPGSQQVVDSWGAGNLGGCLYEHYLVSQGFVCICVDGRGTGGRGAAFARQTYLNLGQLEAKDQVETALYTATLPYVDKDRIGIWGWSYGGFCTLMSMTEGRPVFAAGVAVAPVTSYRFYDSVYTERYMRTPKENPTGYDNNALTRAPQLHGALLICHGGADDNVHFRNTAEMTEALVQADKPFMQLVYTNRNHSIYGGNTRLHLFRSITDWFRDKLGK